jgi:hypothetical protein
MTVPTYEEDIARLLPPDWKDPVGYEVRRSYLESLAYEGGDAFVEMLLAAIDAHLKGEHWPNDCPAIHAWIEALQDLDRGRLYYAASRRHDGAQVLHDALVFWVGEEITNFVELYLQRLREINFRRVHGRESAGAR